jgi:hypothetical protein
MLARAKPHGEHAKRAIMAEEMDQPGYINTLNEPMGSAFVKTN